MAHISFSNEDRPLVLVEASIEEIESPVGVVKVRVGDRLRRAVAAPRRRSPMTSCPIKLPQRALFAHGFTSASCVRWVHAYLATITNQP
jgi:hypothetical protein